MSLGYYDCLTMYNHSLSISVQFIPSGPGDWIKCDDLTAQHNAMPSPALATTVIKMIIEIMIPQSYVHSTGRV